MTDLTKYLQDYMQMISRSIESCKTHPQLHVCFDFIHLFELRYRGWIDNEELLKNVKTLTDLYYEKDTKLLIP